AAFVRIDRKAAAGDAFAVDALIEPLGAETHDAAPRIDLVVPRERARIGARREAKGGQLVVDRRVARAQFAAPTVDRRHARPGGDRARAEFLHRQRIARAAEDRARE